MYAEKPLHKLIDCSYFKETILVIGVVRAVKAFTCNSQCRWVFYMINALSLPEQQYWTALQGEKRTSPRTAALLPSHIGWGTFSSLFNMYIW